MMQLVQGLGYVQVEPCHHCSELHPITTRACPATGKPMPRFMQDPVPAPPPPDPNAPAPVFTKAFKFKDNTAATLPDDPQEAWAFLATHDLTGLQGPGLDLAGYCLSGLDLSGANLTGANLRGAVCEGTCFKTATLTNACFDAATLVKCNFSDATLNATTFRQARLDNDGKEINGPCGRACVDTDFTGATLRNLQFVGVGSTPGRLVFDDATLKQCSFEGKSAEHGGHWPLRGSTFRRARLQGVRFSNVRLDDADLREAHLGLIVFQNYVSLAHADLSDATLAWIPWSADTGPRLNLSGARLRGLKFDASLFLQHAAQPSSFGIVRFFVEVQELEVLVMRLRSAFARVPAREGLFYALFTLWLEEKRAGRDLLLRAPLDETLAACLTAGSHWELEFAKRAQAKGRAV